MQQAWLELIHTRDNFYLYAAVLVVMAWGWYRFLAARWRRAFRLAALGAVLVVGLGCGWGVWHLFVTGGY